MCVEVPYGTRTLLGAVTSCVPLADMKSQVKNMSFQLKNINRVIQQSPLSPAVLLSIQSYHEHTLVPRNLLLDRVIPVHFLESIREYISDKHSENLDTSQFLEHHISLLQQPEPDRISIYMTRVREVLSQGNSIIIICPSVAIVNTLKVQVGKGIDEHIVVLHGQLTKKKQSESYQRLFNSKRGVVCIMTPYFLGCAPRSTSLVIIHNSTSSEYLSPMRPYINFVPLIEDFTRTSGIECMLSDTLLTLGNTKRIDTDTRVSWYTHASYRGAQDLSFYSLEHDFSKHIIHPEILEKIKQKLDESKNIALFVPRTGYASITKCNDCQHVVACPTCDAPMRLHRNTKTQHRCTRCKASVPPVDACQKCGGSRLVMLGVSVEKVVECLSEHINSDLIIPITSESMSKKKNINHLDTLVKKNLGLCVVGTTALLNLSYQFDSMIVVSAAHLFAHTEYNSYEESLRLGMCLRELTLKEFFIQTPKQYTELVNTYWNMPVLEQLVYENELRKEYELPPHTHKAHIICPSETMNALREFMDTSVHILASYKPSTLKRMPYHGYRGGICIEISFQDKKDLRKLIDHLQGFKGSVYILEK